MNRINKPAMLLAIVAAAGMVAATMWTSTPAEELVETPAVPAPATPLQADMQQLQVATQASWQPVSAGSYDSRVDTREEVIYKADHLPVYPQFVDVESGEIQLCQYVSGCGSCGAPNCDGDCFPMSAAYGGQDPYGNGGQGGRAMVGVDGFNCHGREPGWTDQHLVPFEAFAYGEYVGPYRTPHLPEYRIRIGDQLEFIYMLTRDRSAEPYKFYVGDVISISSNTDVSLNVEEVEILSDGTISLDLIGQVVTAGKTVSDLQDELNEKYEEFVKKPGIVVRVVQSDTPLQDLRDAVDARAGQGGQARIVQVTPDGTFSLPLIGNVPAIGLSLDEVRREVNARYRMALRGGGGIEVTPALLQRAQSCV
ncbi:MAG: polysaccharide biosynthesis/export family protein [Planctomycetota bacterium]